MQFKCLEKIISFFLKKGSLNDFAIFQYWKKSTIFIVIKQYWMERSNPVRLIEIDIESQKVVLMVKRRAMIIKSTIQNVIIEQNLIKGLSSLDACCIGFHYGRTLNTPYNGRKPLKLPDGGYGYQAQEEKSRFQIIFQNRDGKIGYIDNKTQEAFLENPIIIARHKSTLLNFTPYQACIIGIHAGLLTKKIIKQNASVLHKSATEVSNVQVSCVNKE